MDAPNDELAQPPGKQNPNRVWGALKALARTRITAGLITILPIYITILLLRFVFQFMRDSSQWIVYGVLRGDWVPYVPSSWGIQWIAWTQDELQNPRVQWGIAIFSVFLTIFLLYVIGVFTANIVGNRVLLLLERLVDRVPFVKTVYRACKQTLSTFSAMQSSKSQRVALIPYPSADCRSVAFITGTSRDIESGHELVTCFMATTPHMTTGYVLVVRRADVVELDWNVEDAVKLVMSGGIVVPSQMHFSAANATHTAKSSAWVTSQSVNPGLASSTEESTGRRI